MPTCTRRWSTLPARPRRRHDRGAQRRRRRVAARCPRAGSDARSSGRVGLLGARRRCPARRAGRRVRGATTPCSSSTRRTRSAWPAPAAAACVHAAGLAGEPTSSSTATLSKSLGTQGGAGARERRRSSSTWSTAPGRSSTTPGSRRPPPAPHWPRCAIVAAEPELADAGPGRCRGAGRRARRRRARRRRALGADAVTAALPSPPQAAPRARACGSAASGHRRRPTGSPGSADRPRRHSDDELARAAKVLRRGRRTGVTGRSSSSPAPTPGSARPSSPRPSRPCLGRRRSVVVVKPAQTGVGPDEPGDVDEVRRLRRSDALCQEYARSTIRSHPTPPPASPA